MSIQQNKEIARRYFDEYLANKGIGSDALFAEEYQFHSPTNKDPLNLAGYHDFTLNFFRAFPDARFTITDVVAEGDKVVTHYTLHATQAAPWITNIPVTGKSFRIEGFELHRINDGKIIEQWSLFDQAGAFQQLGISAKRS